MTRILDILGSQLADGRQWLEKTTDGLPLDNLAIADSGDLDSPWEVSSDSEPESELEQDRAKPSNTSLGRKAKQLLEATELAIKCLYILPLRKPAPLDRLKDRFVANREPSPFAEYDLRYVRDKFPGLEPLAQQSLARMITRRRQLLVYRRQHSERLAARGDESDTGDPRGDDSEARDEGDDDKYHGAPDAKVPHEPRTGPATQYTKATTVLIDPEVPFILGENVAQLISSTAAVVEDDTRTSVAGSRATREIRLEVPPRPKQSDGKPAILFKCNYCFIPIQIGNDRSWRYVWPTA